MVPNLAPNVALGQAQNCVWSGEVYKSLSGSCKPLAFTIGSLTLHFDSFLNFIITMFKRQVTHSPPHFHWREYLPWPIHSAQVGLTRYCLFLDRRSESRWLSAARSVHWPDVSMTD